MKKIDQVRTLLAQGFSAPEIAKKLKVKPAYVHTVKWLDKKNGKPKKPVLKMKSFFEAKQALDVIEKKPTKLIIQPQFAKAALDLINNPPHYRTGGIETIDFIEAKDLNYRLGNVVKYVSRAGRKNTDPVQDLEKAAWYLQREITARKQA
jgi:hypothetical protein